MNVTSSLLLLTDVTKQSDAPLLPILRSHDNIQPSLGGDPAPLFGLIRSHRSIHKTPDYIARPAVDGDRFLNKFYGNASNSALRRRTSCWHRLGPCACAVAQASSAAWVKAGIERGPFDLDPASWGLSEILYMQVTNSRKRPLRMRLAGRIIYGKMEIVGPVSFF